ncbi:hypothetical protein CRUP_015563, partial [Coryphaenoides rupestris]
PLLRGFVGARRGERAEMQDTHVVLPDLTEHLPAPPTQKPVWKDGCTATCLLVVHTTAYIANLGDSRAVLCQVEGVGEEQRVVSLALSREHNPTLYEERIRIQRAGAPSGTHTLTSADRFILLACDGLFKVFTAQQAVKYVFSQLQVGGVWSEPLDPVRGRLGDQSITQLIIM